MVEEDEAERGARTSRRTRPGAARLGLVVAALGLATAAGAETTAEGAAPAAERTGVAAATETTPQESTADETTADEAPTAGWRRLGYGLSVGYGHGIAVRRVQNGRDVADVQLLTFEPQLRWPLVRAGNERAWYHGVLEGTLEGVVLVNFSPHGGHGGGASAGLRYRFGPGRRIQPYAEGALGVGGIGLDLQAQADGFTFFIQAGAGARVRLDDRVALTASARWQHISNAQTHLPNAGIDTLGFRIGLEIR